MFRVGCGESRAGGAVDASFGGGGGRSCRRRTSEGGAVLQATWEAVTMASASKGEETERESAQPGEGTRAACGGQVRAGQVLQWMRCEGCVLQHQTSLSLSVQIAWRLGPCTRR